MSDPPGTKWLRDQTKAKQYAAQGGAPEFELANPASGAQVPYTTMYDAPFVYTAPDLPPTHGTDPISVQTENEDKLLQQQDEAQQRWDTGKTPEERAKAQADFMRFADQFMKSLQSGTRLTRGVARDEAATAQAPKDADAMMRGVDQPKTGRQRGTLHLLPQYQSLGAIRPFGPGEWLDRHDGSWSSEESYTLPFKGGWSVIPSLWMVNGAPMMVDEETATQYATQSKLNWPSFPDEKTADAFATARESKWQTVPQGRSDMQQPLWSRPWPPGL
jgi:hypothetical protein